MSPRFMRSSNILPLSVDPIINLWIYRVLVPLGAYKEFIMDSGFSDDGVASTLELENLEKNLEDGSDKGSVKKELVIIYESFEKENYNSQVSSVLANNVRKIAKMVGLSHSECRIFEFSVILKNEQVLENAADILGQLSTSKVCYVLSVLLDLVIEDVRHAFSTKSALFKSGLVTIDRNGSSESPLVH